MNEEIPLADASPLGLAKTAIQHKERRFLDRTGKSRLDESPLIVQLNSARDSLQFYAPKGGLAALTECLIDLYNNLASNNGKFDSDEYVNSLLGIGDEFEGLFELDDGTPKIVRNRGGIDYSKGTRAKDLVVRASFPGEPTAEMKKYTSLLRGIYVDVDREGARFSSTPAFF